MPNATSPRKERAGSTRQLAHMDQPAPHGQQIERRCTATSKQSKERCKRFASPGFTVCAMHGGKTPVGLAASNFKHGRRSKHLLSAPKLRAHYEDALRAGLDLLDLKDDLATVDGFIALALERIGTGDSTAIWEALRKAKTERTAAQRRLAAASRSGNEDAKSRARDQIAEQLNEIDRLIDQGVGIVSAVDDVRQLTGDRVRLVESQRRGMVEAQQYIALQQVQAIFALIEDVIRRNVVDRDSLASISRELAQVAAQLPG